MNYLFIFLYLFIYFIFFQIKSVRDYIMEYEKGHPDRWNTSIWAKLTLWFQGYMLDNEQMFIENDPPRWAIFIFWNIKNNRFRLGHLDGWHQTDGIIFIAPHILIIMILGYLLGVGIFMSFLFSIGISFIWYEYFNFIYHIQQRIDGHKEYDRVWWMKWFKK